MATGYNGLRACLGERRGRRELRPVLGNQEKGESYNGLTVNNPSACPHPVPYSPEAQEITVLFRSTRNYGVRHCYHDIVVVSNEGIRI